MLHVHGMKLTESHPGLTYLLRTFGGRSLAPWLETLLFEWRVHAHDKIGMSETEQCQCDAMIFHTSYVPCFKHQWVVVLNFGVQFVWEDPEHHSDLSVEPKPTHRVTALLDVGLVKSRRL